MMRARGEDSTTVRINPKCPTFPSDPGTDRVSHRESVSCVQSCDVQGVLLFKQWNDSYCAVHILEEIWGVWDSLKEGHVQAPILILMGSQVH